MRACDNGSSGGSSRKETAYGKATEAESEMRRAVTSSSPSRGGGASKGMFANRIMWFGRGLEVVSEQFCKSNPMVWKWFVGALRAALRIASGGLEVRGQAKVRGRLLARPSDEGGVTNHTLAMHGLCTGDAHTVTHKRPSNLPTNTRRLWEAGPT